METQLYNIAFAGGYVAEISEIYHKGDHRIVNLLLDCEKMDGSQSVKKKNLYIKAWDELADQVRVLRPGDRVKVKITVCSKQNNKISGLWYHVLTLKEIEKL